MASHHTNNNNIPAIIISLTIFLFAIAAAAESASFYEVLKSKGLPMGLFPKGISDFSMDPSSGRFELRLVSPSPCDAVFETHVRYQCNITGTLAYANIANLSGVAAQELFLWLPVNAIRVDIPSSGLIYFDVGVVFKQFSLSFFETPKDCNALKSGDGRDDDLVVLFDDRNRPRVIRDHSGNVRESSMDEEGRAVS